MQSMYEVRSQESQASAFIFGGTLPNDANKIIGEIQQPVHSINASATTWCGGDTCCGTCAHNCR